MRVSDKELTFELDDWTPGEYDPITFTIVGRRGKRDIEEEFACHPQIPGVWVLRAAEVMVGNAEATLATILPFFQACMDPVEVARLTHLLEDREAMIDERTIAKIFFALFRKYSGRPTERPRDSEPGPRSNGTTSKERSPSAASTSTG